MKTHKLLPLIACLLLIGTTAMAQPAPPTPRPPAAPGMRMMRMLNLTQQQRDQLMDMRLQMTKEMLPMRTQLSTLRSDLKLELTANNYDQRKVENTVNQMTDVRKKMTLAMLGHLRDVRNILTPDQQKKFDLMIMSQHRGDFGGMAEMGHQRGNWGNHMMRHDMKPPSNNK
jgi:Spy/CpxP family protein refolding chaperone